MRLQIIVFLIIFVSGCCAQLANIPHPVCEQAIPVNEEIWNDLAAMRELMSENSLSYQQCIERYRMRIEAFNE